MASLARILVADDEPDLIEDYQCALAIREAGDSDLRLTELQDELFGPQRSSGSLPQLELVAVNQGEAAVEAIMRAREQGQPFSAAFIDVRMPPGMSGLEAAIKIREIDEQLPIVIVTAYTDIQTIDLAKQIPPADRLFVLQKPFHSTEIQQLAIALTARLELERAERGEAAPAPQILRQLEDLMRALPGGIAVFDDKERLVRANTELESLFPDMKRQLTPGTAYSALREGVSKRVLPDRLMKRADSNLTESGAPGTSRGGIAERRLVGNRWMMIAERPQAAGGAVVQFLDITSVKSAEQRRLLSSSMTHISRFAEGLARRLEAASRRLNLPGEADATQELAEVTRGLLDDLLPVAQRQELAPRPVKIDGLINEVVAELSPLLAKSVRLEVVSTVGLWPVYVDCGQVKRALEAVIRNAVEALDAGGNIYVETLNVRASRETALELPGLKVGDYVCVRITDNGTGMPPEVINRAFMPFFTTKDPTAHRGMGLTLAYSIVAQSGGHLFVDSDGLSETQIRLLFPRTQMTAPPKKNAAESS